MEKFIKFIIRALAASFLFLIIWTTEAKWYPTDPSALPEDPTSFQPPDTIPYPFKGNTGNPLEDTLKHPLYLNPSVIQQEVVYDPVTNSYIFTDKIGETPIGDPFSLSFDDYVLFNYYQSQQKYWRDRARLDAPGDRGGLIPRITIPGDAFAGIFGSNTVDIRPQGSAELIFGVKSNYRNDPALSARQRRYTNFDFQQKIQMKVMAKVGDKINFGLNYNTEATFEFDNKTKLAYEGKEDEIIKLVEFGDVTMPLNGTLITGSQRLFGIKTKMQFGKATVTTVFSKQESKSQSITVSGGAQMSEFYFKADQYEENRHFFIGQYFRDNYNKALENLPIVNSPVNITNLEVWVTNVGAATTENRNIIALLDLGEQKTYTQVYNAGPSVFPDNQLSNDMLQQLMPAGSGDSLKMRDINQVSTYLKDVKGLTQGIHFEKIENARKLNPNEYTFNPKLGFISLNMRLNTDQVLAVSYQYQVVGQNEIYRVGEFSNGGITGKDVLVTKLLRSTTTNVDVPTWDLMMKNVYSLQAFQVNKDDFRLNVVYTHDENGVPMGYFTEGKINGIPLIRVMNMDNLNVNMEPVNDGVFDFLDGAATGAGTIQANNGRIYFPQIEPFGKDLRAAFGDNQIADKYVFEELYRKTKTDAQQLPQKNKFYLEGRYKSSGGAEISIGGFNIPKGSVKVTAGGVLLTENVHYTVDYTLGRVKIIDEGYLNSGVPITINTESEDIFNFQTKRLMGTHIDYKISNNFNLGATVLNLHERPITYKVNYGDEPISNTIWGLDAQYQSEVPFVTKMIDKLPFIDTKAPSSINFEGEFAHLIPGHPRVIGKTGTSYIDDFEGSSSGYDIKNIGQWKMASTPQGQTDLFYEGNLSNSLGYGFNRAKFAWYVVDPIFFEKSNPIPVTIEDKNNHYVRQIREQEVFPNKEKDNNVEIPLAVLNLYLNPAERGPYNFETSGTSFSAGLNPDGTLKDPSSRWGGIMRRIETPDFEATNVEYIEFWMMDPFIDPDYTNQANGPLEALQDGGYLYINLGDISEDILKDGRKSWENGLPNSPLVKDVDTTIWGRVPTGTQIVNAFDNNPNARKYQDVGLDGLGDDDERSFFTTYLADVAALVNTNAYTLIEEDPAADNYHYFRGPDLDQANANILERYMLYNGQQGNSNTSEQDQELGITNFSTLATTLPDNEDINNDNTLSEGEKYFQYRIDLTPGKMVVGENYITDIYEAVNVPLRDNKTANVKWYQFKIPVRQYEKVVGDIRDFKSIRFMRMYMRGFSEPVALRFATLELVRGEWRKYGFSLLQPGEYIPIDDQSATAFHVSTVNIEENAYRNPVTYALPPDIERERNIISTTLSQLNEQSLSLKVCNLLDGDARAVYKITDFDLRRYKKLKMYVHAESACSAADEYKNTLQNGDLTLFVRLGNDFTGNYYEYEVPLEFTPWGTTASQNNGRALIWPETNNMEIDLEALAMVKQARNTAIRSGDMSVSITAPYTSMDGDRRITVIGTPNLSDVKTIMIGIRNPKKAGIIGPDDGMSKSAEVWVNELRLTDFNEHGGWAAQSRISATLADLGTLQLAGNISTPGFGSIDKKILDRQQETIFGYDVATNLELGRFFPEKSGIKIPMHFDFSENISNPEYNPLNPDVLFQEDLNTYANKAERDSVKKLSQDYVMRKSLNFVNVSKMSTGKGKAPRFYDISNFNVSYAYNETYLRNIDIEYDRKQKYTGMFAYNFNSNPKPVRVFSKSKFLSKYKALAIIRDFNFYYSPKLISFRTSINREYQEQKIRNKSIAMIIIDPTYLKKYEWSRQYDVKYDLSQGIRLEYGANAMALFREPDGKRDRDDQAYRDTIFNQFLNLGDLNNLQQQFGVNWTVPVNKLPLMDWLSVNARYAGTYQFTGALLAAEELGGTIENSNNIMLTGSGNLTTLYNKIPYLKQLQQSTQSATQAPGQRFTKEIKELDAEGKTPEDTVPINVGRIILDNFFRILTGVKNVSLNYTETNGFVLPGFAHKPKYLGNVWEMNAPGVPFVLGWQEDNLLEKAFRDNWMIQSDSLLTAAYAQNLSQNLTFRSTIEPLPGLRVEINANRTLQNNESAVLRRVDTLPYYVKYTPQVAGNFSISFLSWKTAFIETDNEEYTNETYNNMLKYRVIIAERYKERNINNWTGLYLVDPVTGEEYPDGYGATQQDVLLSAFLAAYAGVDPDRVELSPFPKIPMPNWTITYNGLTQIPFMAKYFRTFSVSHAYRSTFNIGGFSQNIRYTEDDDGMQIIRDELGNNYLPRYDIGQVTISEQFSPLLKFDMTMENSLMANIEFKRSRTLSLSFANYQITEIFSKEFVIGSGYRVKDVKFKINSGGRTLDLKSDLTLRLDFSFRNNITVLRKIVEQIDQPSMGQKNVSINFSADYMISQQINLRLFYDQIITRPHVSNQYDVSNTNAGISIRFSLAQ
ncbi:MAG TPA: cell surface protein SprA [Bacteroidales bacterium]|nr:cell surface protein SprA [Bacteroidales bacterium]HRZ48253.1 cell surface protein SprA [Bacteroidales bacterium]